MNVVALAAAAFGYTTAAKAAVSRAQELEHSIVVVSTRAQGLQRIDEELAEQERDQRAQLNAARAATARLRQKVRSREQEVEDYQKVLSDIGKAEGLDATCNEEAASLRAALAVPIQPIGDTADAHLLAREAELARQMADLDARLASVNRRLVEAARGGQR
ncbi:hypothetical protein Rsub_08860 [Raphidocelis subcapitata]|uniref:Uncharacterized protein n=1 Tax=Raphidocelis subcapitata TaxID=307507 RepID=A0A2V0PG58_9CHLO|nr:hypothetical protein Rsub_08860 [Raphidocelis subcapitata]|eukprot:GBF96045.1 hypothetical protein Rsub_08860 [Raphidocelis subcapitata]